MNELQYFRMDFYVDDNRWGFGEFSARSLEEYKEKKQDNIDFALETMADCKIDGLLTYTIRLND